MANILTHATQHAKANLLAAGIKMGHAKLQEIMAALLGYRTYSALKHEEDNQELKHHLSDAEFIILHQELGECRAADVCELPCEVVPRCIAALEECLPTPVLQSVDAYLAHYGLNAVVAALTSDPLHGLHLEIDWSSRHKLSRSQRLSFHEAVWDARHLWHVHAEFTMQSITPDAETHKVNVLLTHAKAGRSGLILKGVKPIVDITAVIETTRVDWMVQRDDGSVVRPWLAVVLHIPSATVLGSAVSLVEDLDLLEVNALSDALNLSKLEDNDGHKESGTYRIIQLDMDQQAISVRLRQIALKAGIQIIQRPKRREQMARVETIIYNILKSIVMNLPNPPEK